MIRRLAGTAFWILLVLLVIANAIVMWHSLTVLRFWEDEAFNLTVSRNLVAGLGYTSDGALSGSTLTPFDPRISTGPVVLLPVAGVLALGADPVIGARLVPLAYWVLLLIGCAVLGRRLAGRPGALVAAALPLAFNTADSVSPIQGPADLLGEIAAAALLVWALIVLPRRAWLAGLLFGLAVQAKLIALLALPAFAVALFLLTPVAPFRRRLLVALRRAVPAALLVAVPTLLVELGALLSLGLTGYVGHLRALLAFVRSGGQHYEPTTIPQKLTTLAGSWFVPGWLVAASVVAAAIIVAWAAVPSRRAIPADGAPARRWWDRDPQLLAFGFGSVVGLLAFVGWWAQASQLPLWVRHPSVGVFAFAPVLAAITVRAAATLWNRRGASGPAVPVRLVTATAALLLVAVVGGGALGDVGRAVLPSTAQPLSEQRAIAAPIGDWARSHDVSWIGAQPWGAVVPLIVLAGAHVGLADAPAMKDAPILLGGDCPSGAPVVTPTPGLNLCPAQ